MRRRVHRPKGVWVTRADEYLSFRRGLGFSLRTTGDELLLFARHLDSLHDEGPLTAAAAIHWAQLPTSATSKYWPIRLNAVRPFARYLAATDPRHEVPPAGAFGRQHRRPTPHIYSQDEVRALLGMTRIIKPVDKLPPHTFRTFFGLLAATGMRCGEALNLRREHVDLSQGRITIERGKFGKSRVLPVDRTVVTALAEYADRRDSEFPRGVSSSAFFLSRRATALAYQRVTNTFRMLRRALGWNQTPAPRVHDLRHTFAVRTLIRWSKTDDNVDNKIATLSTYMGHVHFTSTYWYFSAVPELMAIAGRKFERGQGSHR